MGKVEEIADSKPSYKLGHDGSDGTCDCIGLIIGAIRRAGGRWPGTLAEARAKGMLRPGALLFIHEEDERALPARYAGDGLGDFSHVGLYVGENALTDVDKSGNARSCDVVHSSATMGRVAVCRWKRVV